MVPKGMPECFEASRRVMRPAGVSINSPTHEPLVLPPIAGVHTFALVISPPEFLDRFVHIEELGIGELIDAAGIEIPLFELPPHVAAEWSEGARTPRHPRRPAAAVALSDLLELLAGVRCAARPRGAGAALE